MGIYQGGFFELILVRISMFIVLLNGPRVKTALRLPPSAQAENQFSALFPGKRAENSDPSLATEKGRKLPKIRPGERCKIIIFCLFCLFCLFVFLSFCLFVFLYFCLLVFLSRHHVDQMSEGCQVSKVTICVKILKWHSLICVKHVVQCHS